jgi:hypothetical protein
MIDSIPGTTKRGRREKIASSSSENTKRVRRHNKKDSMILKHLPFIVVEQY